LRLNAEPTIAARQLNLDAL